MALTTERRTPAHRSAPLIGLVVAGGTVGTAARAAIEDAFGAPAGAFPWATFAINVSGALLLGVLLEALVLLGPDAGARRGLRLALGTGLLGGYTTYSTFVLESVGLAGGGGVALALAYDAASLVGGFAAAGLAMGVTRRIVRARHGGVQ